MIPTAQQSADDPLAARARIPSTAWREARAALEFGPVLIQNQFNFIFIHKAPNNQLLRDGHDIGDKIVERKAGWEVI